MIFSRLNVLNGDSVNRKIFRAILVVGVLTAGVKAAATLKELITARWFGRSDALDAFLIAFLLPSFLVGLALSALQSAFVPAFIRTRRQHGIEAAQRLFSGVMLLTLLLLAATAGLLIVLAPYYLRYLGAGFSVAKLRLTHELLYWLLPFIFFSGIATCASAVLNAGERFALPALSPILTPLVTILFLQATAQRWSTFSLAAGLVAGSALEATLLVRAMSPQGIHFSLRWYGLDPALRTVLRQYTPMLAGAFLMGSTSVVDQSMAAMLTPGSVAALSYAGKITGVILGLSSTGLNLASLPYLSKMAAENDWKGCRHTLKTYSFLVFSTTVPLTIALMLLSRPLVRLLFQRGAFTPADTELVSWVQTSYAIQIPFYCCSQIFVRFLSAIQRNDLLLYVSGFNLVLDIILNVALMRVWGVAGIALSTSLVYTIGFVVVTVWSIKLLRQHQVALLVSPEALTRQS